MALLVFVITACPLTIFPIMGPPMKYTGLGIFAPPASATTSSTVTPMGTRTVTG